MVSRVLRYGAYAAAALVVLVLAAAFAVPRLLDRPRMAAELQAKLSNVVQGEVRWQEFSLRILPRPHGNLRALRVETAAATFTADEVTLALKLWPLFMGRAEISSLEVERPVLRLTVVPAAAVPKEAQLAPPPASALEAYRSAMGTLVQALQEFAPDTVVQIDKADVSIRVEGLPPIEASNLAVRGRTSGHGVELEASAISRYWNSMRLTGRIEYTNLPSSTVLHLTGINGQAWLDWLLRSSGVSGAGPSVGLNARFLADAGKALELDVDANVAAIGVTSGGPGKVSE